MATGGQVLRKRVNGQTLLVDYPQMMPEDALTDMRPPTGDEPRLRWKGWE
jgi:hypothetical protein